MEGPNKGSIYIFGGWKKSKIFLPNGGFNGDESHGQKSEKITLDKHQMI